MAAVQWRGVSELATDWLNDWYRLNNAFTERLDINSRASRNERQICSNRLSVIRSALLITCSRRCVF